MLVLNESIVFWRLDCSGRLFHSLTVLFINDCWWMVVLHRFCLYPSIDLVLPLFGSRRFSVGTFTRPCISL